MRLCACCIRDWGTPLPTCHQHAAATARPDALDTAAAVQCSVDAQTMSIYAHGLVLPCCLSVSITGALSQVPRVHTVRLLPCPVVPPVTWASTVAFLAPPPTEDARTRSTGSMQSTGSLATNGKEHFATEEAWLPTMLSALRPCQASASTPSTPSRRNASRSISKAEVGNSKSKALSTSGCTVPKWPTALLALVR